MTSLRCTIYPNGIGVYAAIRNRASQFLNISMWFGSLGLGHTVKIRSRVVRESESINMLAKRALVVGTLWKVTNHQNVPPKNPDDSERKVLLEHLAVSKEGGIAIHVPNDLEWDIVIVDSSFIRTLAVTQTGNIASSLRWKWRHLVGVPRSDWSWGG